MHDFIVMMLGSGLWVDLMSAVALSLVYRAPLLSTSSPSKKLTLADRWHCGGTFIINFLALFSWALVYVLGGVASTYYGKNSLRNDGVDDDDLLGYLVVSGAVIFCSALVCCFWSGPLACPAPLKCMESCFKAIGNNGHTKVVFRRASGSIRSGSCTH